MKILIMISWKLKYKNIMKNIISMNSLNIDKMSSFSERFKLWTLKIN